MFWTCLGFCLVNRTQSSKLFQSNRAWHSRFWCLGFITAWRAIFWNNLLLRICQCGSFGAVGLSKSSLGGTLYSERLGCFFFILLGVISLQSKWILIIVVALWMCSQLALCRPIRHSQHELNSAHKPPLLVIPNRASWIRLRKLGKLMKYAHFSPNLTPIVALYWSKTFCKPHDGADGMMQRMESRGLVRSKEPDQFQISPAAPEISHHTVWRPWLFIPYSDERWLHFQFLSLPHLYISFKRWWTNVFFELGSERVIACFIQYSTTSVVRRSRS